MMTDDAILALYWARSEQALAQAAEKYGGYCYAIAHGILSSRQDAEECVQDTWLKSWNAIPPHRPQKLAAFLGKITRNCSLDRLKRGMAGKRGGGQLPLVLSELEDCIPVSAADETEDAMLLTDALNSFLEGLTPLKRRVFLQRYWYMLPVKMVAAQNKLSAGQTASMLLRMRQELKGILEREGICL